MERSVLRKEILPLALVYGGLLVATVVIDLFLHGLGLAWVGRWAGIPGTLLILTSLGYSLRKRKWIHHGKPRSWLRLHETLAWAGCLLVLVHAGIHFNALLPWLALFAMLVNVASGLTGKFLLGRSGRHLASRREYYAGQELAPEDVESRLFWDEIALDMMRQWRVVHFPISLAFGVLALTHIISILLFWGVALMARALLILVVLNLVAALALVFVYPEPMIAPGPLLQAHADAQLSDDCFACHLPLRGVAERRCTTCHELDRIGLFTTDGEPLAGEGTAFHQHLLASDCTACHTEHVGAHATGALRTFSHALLDPQVREDCAGCHASPDDRLHSGIAGDCASCHVATAWTPAQFDHDEYFRLDRDHDASCDTCHQQDDFSQYSCYGCHEHSPAGIRREHQEEGIRDFENCVECHRSGDEHEARRRDGRREREDDDD